MSNHMPPDLIEKILFKLPVKSVLRFMLLQKSCYSFINSEKFNAAYTPQPNNPPLLFIGYTDRDGEANYSLRYDDAGSKECIPRLHFPFGAYTSVVSCSNGLVCLFDSLLNKLILWNPCIQRFLTLPDPNSIINRTCIFGLGFVNETNNYKVLISNHKDDAEIYSLKHNSWKMIAGTKPKLAYYHQNVLPHIGGFFNWSQRKARHKGSVSLKGSLYWLQEKMASKWCVGVFDFKDEVFGEISLPDDWGCRTPMSLSLMVRKESSIAIVGGSWNDIRVLDVDWMEKKWERISSVFPFPRAESWRVVGFKKSGEVITEDDELGILSLGYSGLRTIIRQQPHARTSFVYNFVSSLALFGNSGDSSPTTCLRIAKSRKLLLR